MDANGDTQGNYTLIGRQPYDENGSHEHGLYPVGVFHIPQNHSTIPVSIHIYRSSLNLNQVLKRLISNSQCTQ